MYESLHACTMIPNASDIIFLVTTLRPLAPEIPLTYLI